MGRASFPKGKARTERIAVRVTPAEHAAIAAQARQCKVTPTSYVRSLLFPAVDAEDQSTSQTAS